MAEKAARKPAAKKAAPKKAPKAVAPEPVVEDAREVATEVEKTVTEYSQEALVSSREYGDSVRRESIARNRMRRDEAQKAQTLSR